MAVTIIIPTALRRFADGNAELQVQAESVREALELVVVLHPELRPHLYRDHDALRHFVNVYINDEDIRFDSGLATPVKDGDSILIVPTIAGGATPIRSCLTQP